MREGLFPATQSYMCEMRYGIKRELHHGMQYVAYLIRDTPDLSHSSADRKFHVEHFTCSICPTLFGPQDSYYEHDNDVYCHYHYSTRFATKCAGCNTAILKQFVEINRNMRDECWHPECYMINKVCGYPRPRLHFPLLIMIGSYLKFWNVKVVSRRPTSLTEAPSDLTEPPFTEEERRETHTSLKEKQNRMEQQVYRIWT